MPFLLVCVRGHTGDHLRAVAVGLRRRYVSCTSGPFFHKQLRTVPTFMVSGSGLSLQSSS